MRHALRRVGEEGRLRAFVISDLRTDLRRQFGGVDVGDGLRPRGARLVGQRPVVAVVGKTEKDLRRLDACDGVVQHPPDGGQRCDGERRPIGIAPLIGHQQHGVRRRAERGIVVPLIEDTALCVRGLGREGDGQLIAEGVHPLSQHCGELGIRRGVLRAEKLKVHVQSLVALFRHRPHDRVRERHPRRRILEQSRRTLRGKASALRQRGQMQNGSCAVLPCKPQKPLVVRRDEQTVLTDPVGEGDQIGRIGQDLRKCSLVRKGVGVAAQHGGARSFLRKGKHERLPGKELRPAAELRIALQKREDRDAAVLGNRKQRVAFAHGIEPTRREHAERLSDCEPIGRAQSVPRRKQQMRHVEARGDRKQRVARGDDMDRHRITSVHLMFFACQLSGDPV